MVLIAGHSEEELFTKKYYKWTNTTSLGAIFISSTSSHYDWAIKKYENSRKPLESNEFQRLFCNYFKADSSK